MRPRAKRYGTSARHARTPQAKKKCREERGSSKHEIYGWCRATGARLLKRMKLDEVSLVTFPALIEAAHRRRAGRRGEAA